jgi:hypothetical protein
MDTLGILTARMAFVWRFWDRRACSNGDTVKRPAWGWKTLVNGVRWGCLRRLGAGTAHVSMERTTTRAIAVSAALEQSWQWTAASQNGRQRKHTASTRRTFIIHHQYLFQLYTPPTLLFLRTSLRSSIHRWRRGRRPHTTDFHERLANMHITSYHSNHFSALISLYPDTFGDLVDPSSIFRVQKAWQRDGWFEIYSVAIYSMAIFSMLERQIVWYWLFLVVVSASFDGMGGQSPTLLHDGVAVVSAVHYIT